jgi:hypothetical protein
MLIELDRIHDKIGITFIIRHPTTSRKPSGLPTGRRDGPGRRPAGGHAPRIYESPRHGLRRRFLGETPSSRPRS